MFYLIKNLKKRDGLPSTTFNPIKSGAGFTIIELVVAIAIFGLLTAGALSMSSVLSQVAKVSREKTILSSLAANYMEALRNMPYSQVGTIAGNPNGPLPDKDNAISQTIGGITYTLYYDVNYVHDPADPVATAADYKQVKMSIVNNATGQHTDFLTTVAPKGLITNPNTGGLQVDVIDSKGQIISGANVRITYPTTTPYTYNLPDVTNSSGQVTEVGLPRGINAYRVVATLPGYSTDSTLPITAANPNPLHPDATVATGILTKLTLSIDALANLYIKTLNSTCQPLSGINMNVAGAKLIGTSPNVLKFNNNYSSNGAGLIDLSNIEQDTYTPVLLTGQPWVVRGTSPIQKIVVLPGTTQTFTMILGTNTTANSLLVVVKDAATGAAMEDAQVHLRKGGSTPQDYYGTTGGSVWVQNSWVGGAGQAQWSATTKTNYFQDDGNTDVNSNPTGVRLQKITGRYLPSGWLESSTFDTGTSSTKYSILSWAPVSQSASTTLRLLVAANNDNATWNYVGPDGTAGTFFTTPGTDIGASLDNNRYVRYKAYLSTDDDKKTPELTSVNLNFVAGCFTPGQVWFPDLTAGNNYDLDVSLSGYSTEIINSLNINGNQSFEVLMSP